MPQQILGTTVQKTDDAVGIFRNDQEKKQLKKKEVKKPVRIDYENV